MATRTTQERIDELQAKIAAIQARAKARTARKRPEVRPLLVALKSIDGALNASNDQPLRKALDEARTIVASGLGLLGITPKERKAGKRRAQPLAGELDRAAVLTYILNNSGAKGEAIAAAFGTDTATLRPVLKQLAAEGSIRSQGKGRGTTYVPAGKKVAVAAG